MIYRQRPAHAPRAPYMHSIHHYMHSMQPMHHFMHPMHCMHMQGHHCAVLSGSRLSFGGCAQPSGYLVPALDPFRICIWCTIHYLEMQYLVQRDKGCELRHKGSVSPMAAAVRRWANIRASPPCCYVRPCINFVSRTGLAIFIYGIRLNPCIIYCSG